jgi:hypothetical protein
MSHPLSSRRAALAAFAIGGAVLAGPVAATSVAPPFAVDPVVGVWIPTITVRNCATGDPGEVFGGMSVLHHGGTLSETNTSPPATRGPGWGTWARAAGGGYTSLFRFLRYNVDGSLAGYTVIRRQFTLSADGSQAAGQSRFEIQLPNGFVVFEGCTTDVAMRLR